jgi:cellulose synthase/poly-beta-1,6-N-acetylglucosamine synthase-like glycosyltransferase
MLRFIEILFIGAVAWLWLPNLIDLVAAAAMALRRFARPAAVSAPHPTSPPRLVFLVPAHNEEGLISQCARSLVGMDYPRQLRRIIVIADNSTDGTARLARDAGAECFERHDRVNRGKPHALAWAIAQLNLAEIDACVVVDADTVVAPDFARGLAALAPLETIAAQAYIGTMNEWDNWLTRLAGVLARCRYEFTYVLRNDAGLNCPLTGNGMCIGRELLTKHGWQAFSLTENWELYARYTAEGVPIRFARESRLYTQQVRSMEQGQIQRSRWSAGRTWTLREWGPRIVRSTRTSLLNKFATLGELAALTPVIHLTAAAGVFSAALVLPAPAAWWIATAALASLASPVVATATVMLNHPEPATTLSAFARLPVYATWRVSVAARTLLLPDSGEWRKTERNAP